MELAGAISDIAKLYMRHDFRHIDPSKARVLLLDNGPRILAAYPPDLSAKAEAELKNLGVEVHTGTQVTGVGAATTTGLRWLPASRPLRTQPKFDAGCCWPLNWPSARSRRVGGIRR